MERCYNNPHVQCTALYGHRGFCFSRLGCSDLVALGAIIVFQVFENLPPFSQEHRIRKGFAAMGAVLSKERIK